MVASAERQPLVAVILLEQFLDAVIVEVARRQAGASAFLALHRAAEQYRQLAAFLDQVCAGQMRDPGHIHHRWIMLSRASDQDSVQVIGLHEIIKVSFHSFDLSDGVWVGS